MEVMSTSPSGTMGTSAATMDSRASRSGAPVRLSCVHMVSMPVGTNR